ncbi:PKD domain-containing protein [Mobiluncus curtisii]|uniref:PKD domain-containing protein n=1 Tax=Mobiluncus curtisii TaxID=2051 RepID=UPI001F30893C|nr:PKD domain-containing protein [Mobiluncus curtisii]
MSFPRRARMFTAAIATLFALSGAGVGVANAIVGDFSGMGNVIQGVISGTFSDSRSQSFGYNSTSANSAAKGSGGSKGQKKSTNGVSIQNSYDWNRELREALKVKVESPKLFMNPAKGHVAVNKDVYVWADAKPQKFVKTVASQTLTIIAVPIRFEWKWGDGNTTDSGANAGAPWPEGTVTHKYQRVGSYTINCRIHWRATWAIGKDKPQEIPGDVVTESTSTEFLVKYLIPYLS